MNKTTIKAARFLEPSIVRYACVQAIKRLNPVRQLRNPVMFMVAVGALLSTWSVVHAMLDHQLSGFTFQITLLALVHGVPGQFRRGAGRRPGKAQAESLRRSISDLPARKVLHYGARWLQKGDGQIKEVPADCSKKAITCSVPRAKRFPGDGEVVEGIASVRIRDHRRVGAGHRESGGDRSAVTGGTGF